MYIIILQLLTIPPKSSNPRMGYFSYFVFQYTIHRHAVAHTTDAKRIYFHTDFVYFNCAMSIFHLVEGENVMIRFECYHGYQHRIIKICNLREFNSGIQGFRINDEFQVVHVAIATP